MAFTPQTPIGPPGHLSPVSRAHLGRYITFNTECTLNLNVLFPPISPHCASPRGPRRLDDEALVTTPVITGAQVLDGEVRLFFFEGPYDDALQVLFGMCHDITSTGAGLALWDVDRVYHGDRVLGALGVHVEPIKLRAPLAKLVGEAGTFSTGKVRDMAREGVLRLLFFQRALFGVEVEKTTTTEYHTWVAVGSTYFRHVDDFRLFPTDAMLGFVYKKFGGALTTDDLGITKHHEEEASYIEGQEEMSAGTLARARAAKLKRNPPVVPHNPVYEAEKAKRDAMRATRNFLLLRRRKTTREEEGDDEKEDSQEDVHAHASGGLVGGENHPNHPNHPNNHHHHHQQQQQQLVTTKWRWPAPRPSFLFNVHPKRPTDARIDELASPGRTRARKVPSFCGRTSYPRTRSGRCSTRTHNRPRLS